MRKSNVLVAYADCSASSLDDQLIMMCKSFAFNIISTTRVLQQFKYCRQNGITDDRFLALRGYLVCLCGEQIVEKMEAM